jgi:hypothetical protein
VAQDAPLLDPKAVRVLLAMLRPVASEIVLIGGQALSFWAERYQDTPELSQFAPYASKDIDFFGRAEHVVECARLLGGVYRLYGPAERTVCTGVVTTADGVEIDFVHTPRGVPVRSLKERSVSFPELRVMHPIHVMASRVANVVQIPRADVHSLKQLRASVFIVREFIRRDVLARGEAVAARRLNEQAYDVTISEDGLVAWSQHGIDTFESLATDPELGARFLEVRYPQLRERLAVKRAQHGE